MSDLLLESYPLCWPEGRPRIPPGRRREAQFKVGFARSRDEMMQELERLGAKQIIVSSNVPVRRDGLPYADAREPQDPAVAVYFQRAGKPYVFACDSYRKVAHNLRAVGATVEALRAIARHGATEMLEQAFTGFQALPPARTEASTPWWHVLGVDQLADEGAIKIAYRRLAEQHHPDKGGDHAVMSRLNAAYDEALEDRR